MPKDVGGRDKRGHDSKSCDVSDIRSSLKLSAFRSPEFPRLWRDGNRQWTIRLLKISPQSLWGGAGPDMKPNRTRFLLLTAPLALGLGGSALAADMTVPMYKAPPPLAPAYSWTGWYAGINFGYGTGSSQGNYNVAVAGVPVASYGFNAMPAGGFAGLQGGYNYQIGSFVLGAETDLQGAGITDDRTCLLTCSNGLSTTFDQKLTWFGTTRARIGLASGPVLPYITAGAAYGGIKTGTTGAFGAFGSSTTTNSTTKSGWTWGTGVEAALGGNWTGKVEYLYINLGSTAVSNVLGPVTASFNTKQQEQIVRGGINYRFGPDQSAALATTYDWAGLSVGGTFAADIGRNDSTFTIPGLSTDAFYLSPRGFDIGGLVGYNWQFGRWVFGLEADLADSTGTGYLTSLGVGGLGTTIDQKLSWFGTVRGRVGYAVGSELFYLTGGGAYGQVKDSIIQSAGGVSVSQSFSHDVSGYVVGGGIESKFDLFGLLGRNWTTRTEYLYMGLGNVTDSFTAVPGITQTLNSKLNEQVIRTTVTYRFGG